MVRQQEQVVTGDAVVLDVQIAQLPVRALSAMIDCTVVFVAYMIGVLLWATTLTQFDTALSAAVLIIFTVLALVGYPIAFETATRGRSLGKMALGLRVVSEDGSPERFRQALFRALASVIEIWIFAGGPAVICSLLSPKGKRIGDVFAGTVVISERGAADDPTAADAAAAGVVGVVASIVGPRRRPGRAGPPVPLPRIAIGYSGTRSDRLPNHGRGRRADIAAAPARRSPAIGAGRGAGRAAPSGTGEAAPVAAGWSFASVAAVACAARVPAADVTGIAAVCRLRRVHSAELAFSGSECRTAAALLR